MNANGNKVRHTPGPWVADQNCVYARKPRVHADRTLIAEVGNAEDPLTAQDEWEANARLIAAAPDLLAAIANSDNAHWTTAMRAAMAKATGTD